MIGYAEAAATRCVVGDPGNDVDGGRGLPPGDRSAHRPAGQGTGRRTVGRIDDGQARQEAHRGAHGRHRRDGTAPDRNDRDAPAHRMMPFSYCVPVARLRRDARSGRCRRRKHRRSNRALPSGAGGGRGRTDPSGAHAFVPSTVDGARGGAGAGPRRWSTSPGETPTGNWPGSDGRRPTCRVPASRTLRGHRRNAPAALRAAVAAQR